MVELCGGRATDPDDLGAGEFWIIFHAVLCRPGHRRNEGVLGVLPEDAYATLKARWADPKANQAELLRRIDAALTELKAREESLRTGPEAVRRAGRAAEQKP